jgi:hypothetical protein
LDLNKEENKEQEKQALEERIHRLQQQLNIAKKLRKDGHPAYDDYAIQKLEKPLTEAKQEYQSKFGELPSSLREDVGGGVENPLRMERVMFCG